ncbi:MAG: hypothetical protein AAGJ09_02295 [Pseudomonadota bacterium]
MKTRTAAKEAKPQEKPASPAKATASTKKSTPAPSKTASKPQTRSQGATSSTAKAAEPKSEEPTATPTSAHVGAAPDYGPLDAAEIVFYGFGTIFFLSAGLLALTALLCLRFIHNVAFRSSDGLQSLCYQLEQYLSQIAAYASDPDNPMPFPFSKLPEAPDTSK